VTNAWALVDNPAWAGHTPPAEPLTESACHDRSHFITVQCACGEYMHIHETMLESVPEHHPPHNNEYGNQLWLWLTNWKNACRPGCVMLTRINGAYV